MTKTLKQRLHDGERTIVFAVSRLFHPNLIEMHAIHGGYHGFWIDVEHAGLETRDMESATAAGRACQLDSFVRIPPTDYSLVTRCFESGASGVMAAQIHSPEQAEQFVRWSKFAPRGERGLNAGGYDGRFGARPLAEFCQIANEQSFVAIQIETIGSVNRCEEIASLDGVDMLFVGPADLSQALGVTGDFLHPKCLKAISQVADACRQHGKSLGAVTTTPEHARMLADHGCRMFSLTNDVRTYNAGIQAVKGTFREFFE